MDEQVLDANAIDDLNYFELTGESENIEQEELVQEAETSQEDLKNSLQEEAPQLTEQSEESTTSESEVDEFTKKVLFLKGINDLNKIKFEDDSGAIIERSWNDLTENEKLNIFTNEEDPERDLDEEEILFINSLRENKLSPSQYIKTIQQLAAQQALEQFQLSQIPIYEIDSLSDEELFALDLLEKVGEENITDEELKEALEQAKSNEALFAKQIEGLRTTYKNLEDQQKYNAEQSKIAEAEQLYQEFTNAVLNEISSFNSFANQEIELSIDDKNDIANYMLTRRDTGISDFYTDIQNPATATLAAFWLLRGPEVLNEMESLIKAAYQRGFNVGKVLKATVVSESKTPQVVVQPKKSVSTPDNIDLQSAFSLGDESYLYN